MSEMQLHLLLNNKEIGEDTKIWFLKQHFEKSDKPTDNIVYNKRTLLEHACELGLLKVVKYLVETVELDIHQINQDGESLVLVSARYNHPEIKDYLISKGAK